MFLNIINSKINRENTEKSEKSKSKFTFNYCKYPMGARKISDQSSNLIKNFENKQINFSNNFHLIKNSVPSEHKGRSNKIHNEINIYGYLDEDYLKKIHKSVPDEKPGCESDDDIFEKLIMMNENRVNRRVNVNITKLNISSQSAIAKMNIIFDLGELSEMIASDIINKKNPYLLGVRYKDIHEGPIKKPRTGKKDFPNCMALYIKSPMGTDKNIYIRIFRNSSIMLVGCLIKEDGLAVLKILENTIRSKKKLFESEEQRETLKIYDFQTTMVNSNYTIGFVVDRELLFSFLRNNYSQLCTFYNPGGYGAVKIEFWYNSIKKKQDGMCCCPDQKCNIKKSKKGSGNGYNQCKKIMIAIFQKGKKYNKNKKKNNNNDSAGDSNKYKKQKTHVQGKIVITGGRNMMQTKAAYDYINEIIRKHANQFEFIDLDDL